MHYVLASTSELSETLILRTQYMKGLDLQLAVQGIGFKSLNSATDLFLSYDQNLKSPHSEQLISHFIPEMDFASLQMIISHPVLSTQLQPDLLLSLYQIPASAHVFKTLSQSVLWPNFVLQWLVHKKIKPQELSFLNLLTPDLCCSLLEKATRSELSKMDSLGLLELASELILLKIEIGKIINTLWTKQTLIELKNLRYPVSFKKNPINNLSLNWPRNVMSQTKRIQDKMGFQIQFFVSHPEELNYTLNQLEKVVPDWSQKIEGLA